MAPLPWIAGGGALVGILFGLFGVGGSSFATPVLALLGVHGIVAIASPLPATIPAALTGSIAYLRKRECDCQVVIWSLIGGIPGTIIGALLSPFVGGRALLIASGVVLGIVGIRVLRPVTETQRKNAAARRTATIVIPAAAAIGLFTGLLANGGGFLLVPLYVIVLGLGMRQSSATSLVVIAALSIPTLATHWALGHINWPVATAFAAGAIPGSLLGSRAAQHLHGDTTRKAFGTLLIAFALYFTAKQATSS